MIIKNSLRNLFDTVISLVLVSRWKFWHWNNVALSLTDIDFVLIAFFEL